MHLGEILAQAPQRPASSVPDWMLGYFKRRAISYANGLSDVQTHVCWLQSRNFSIDLRLPLEARQVAAKPLARHSIEELLARSEYEGWAAPCTWADGALSWSDATSFQLHDRWPEPALLQRIGNCMMEFAPSGAYVEDWRLQPSAPGPLIGLRLLEDREQASGLLRHRGGGLIICGEYAALVLGRADALSQTTPQTRLRELVARHADDLQWLRRAFEFETSVALGSLSEGFSVTLSTLPQRVRQPLIPLQGFERLDDGRHLRQTLMVDGVVRQRLFLIDTLESVLPFDQATGFSAPSASWFDGESLALRRYIQPLF